MRSKEKFGKPSKMLSASRRLRVALSMFWETQTWARSGPLASRSLLATTQGPRSGLAKFQKSKLWRQTSAWHSAQFRISAPWTQTSSWRFWPRSKSCSQVSLNFLRRHLTSKSSSTVARLLNTMKLKTLSCWSSSSPHSHQWLQSH